MWQYHVSCNMMLMVNNTTKNPLTAVPIVSVTVLPYFLAYIENFYMYMMSFYDLIHERAVYKIAQPPVGQFCLP